MACRARPIGWDQRWKQPTCRTILLCARSRKWHCRWWCPSHNSSTWGSIFNWRVQLISASRFRRWARKLTGSRSQLLRRLERGVSGKATLLWPWCRWTGCSSRMNGAQGWFWKQTTIPEVVRQGAMGLMLLEIVVGETLLLIQCQHQWWWHKIILLEVVRLSRHRLPVVTFVGLRRTSSGISWVVCRKVGLLQHRPFRHILERKEWGQMMGHTWLCQRIPRSSPRPRLSTSHMRSGAISGYKHLSASSRDR